MKRLFILLLVTIFAVGILAACRAAVMPTASLGAAGALPAAAATPQEAVQPAQDETSAGTAAAEAGRPAAILPTPTPAPTGRTCGRTDSRSCGSCDGHGGSRRRNSGRPAPAPAPAQPPLYAGQRTDDRRPAAAPDRGQPDHDRAEAGEWRQLCPLHCQLYSEGNKIYGLLTVPFGDPPEGGFKAIVFNHGYIPPRPTAPLSAT